MNENSSKAYIESPAIERQMIHAVLRGGLLLASLLMAGGLLLHIFMDGGPLSEPTSFGKLWETASLEQLLMTWGIVILALTPALRVLVLLFLWWKEKDWSFVFVALAVVVVLVVSALLE